MVSDTLHSPMAKQQCFQLSYPALAAKQQTAGKRRWTKGHQRLAACTNSPLTEEDAVQPAKLCFQSDKLQWLTLYTRHTTVRMYATAQPGLVRQQAMSS